MTVEEFAKATGKTVEEVKKELGITDAKNNISYNYKEVEIDNSITDFVPAKSIEEAESYAKRFISDGYSPTFKNQAVYKGLSLQNANEINRTLRELFEKFNMPKLNGIKTISPTSAQGKKVFKDGAEGIAAYNPVEKGIFLNKNILKNAETLEKYNKEAQEAYKIVTENIDNLSDSQKGLALTYKTAGRSLVGDGSIKDYITHEVGHHIQWQVLDTKSNNAIGGNMSIYAPKISGYANASKSEYIAESFVAFCNDERDILDPKFVDYININGLKSKIMALKSNNLNVINDIVFTTKENNVIISTSKQLGKKLGKHATDFGLNPSLKEDRENILGIIQDILNNYDEIVEGDWRGQEGKVDFYIRGNDVVVISNNEFVTILKDGVSNERVKKARTQNKRNG